MLYYHYFLIFESLTTPPGSNISYPQKKHWNSAILINPFH